jgi:hypothetical protein
MGSVPWDYAAVDLALAPIHPVSRELVTGLEGADVLLAIAGRLGVQGPDDLCAVPPVAGPMCHAGFRPAKTMRRTFRIVAFVPGVADQDQLAADVAGRKLSVAAATIIELFSGGGGKVLKKPAHQTQSQGQSNLTANQSISAKVISAAMPHLSASPGGELSSKFPSVRVASLTGDDIGDLASRDPANAFSASSRRSLRVLRLSSSPSDRATTHQSPLTN